MGVTQTKKTVCIIAAGGTGSRLKSTEDKPYVRINGVPLIVRTVGIFNHLQSIDAVILSVHPEKIKKCKILMKKYGMHKVSAIVAGGATRQDSVYNGLCSAPPDTELVVIHDCARPFTVPSLVTKAVKSARKYGGAVVGVRAYDTLKRVDSRDIVEKTINRTIICHAQTPQVFSYPTLCEMYKKAKTQKLCATDDSFLYENYGGTVKMVLHDSCNMKITTAGDLKLAKLMFLDKNSGCKRRQS